MRKNLNESADLLIMKIFTENADSCDLAVPRETGVERHFKTYMKEILNENAEHEEFKPKCFIWGRV